MVMQEEIFMEKPRIEIFFGRGQARNEDCRGANPFLAGTPQRDVSTGDLSKN
jgi:hypothetical protein